MRIQRPRLIPLLFAAAAIPSVVSGQVIRGGRPDSSGDGDRPVHIRSSFERRSSGSISFIQTRPLGGLARNIDFGYGGSANYIYRIDEPGILGLRVAGSLSGYGIEHMRVPLSYSIGGRVQADVTTTNTIGTFVIGPQLMAPDGFIQPYVNAGAGVVWFGTTSSVSGPDDWDNEFATRNYSDGTFTWSLGGGLHIPLVKRSAQVLLDVGAEYFFGGESSYLRRGSIVDLPDGQIQINSYRSETRFLNVNIGARITP